MHAQFIKFLQLAFVSGVVFSVIAGWFTYVFTVLDSYPYLFPVYIIANCSLQIEMLLFVICCHLLPVCGLRCPQICAYTNGLLSVCVSLLFVLCLSGYEKVV